jgi:predicted permease
MRWHQDIAEDLRYGARGLRRQPGFTAVAALILAIGIGANSAVFSAASEVFLRAAPAVRDPGRLVALGRSSGGRSFANFGHLMFQQYRAQASSFSGLAASRGTRLLWQEGEASTVLEGALVTGDYFTVLGVPMSLGRSLLPDDDRGPGATPVVVISEALWRTRFNADPGAVGRGMRLGRALCTIVGVAAPGFRGLDLGDAVDLWLPLSADATIHGSSESNDSDFFKNLGVVGRLKPGVSEAQAAAELAVVSSRIEKPEGNPSRTLHAVLTTQVRLPDPGWRAYAASLLATLGTITALVLIIACANVAGLLLARGAARRREIAVRLALGASRARLVRQLLAECLPLVALGSLGGVLLAQAVMSLLRQLIDGDLALGIDGPTLAFVSAMAVVTTLLSGLAPALVATRTDVAAEMKQQRAPGRRRFRLHHLLVGGQVAVSLTLLTVAGLFVRTLLKATAVDLGFETRHLVVVTPDLKLSGYNDARARVFHATAVERISLLPEVRRVSLAASLPRQGNMFWGDREVVRSDAPPAEAAVRFRVEHNEVGPAYFTTLGVSVLRGREFSAADDSGAPAVAVINQAMASQLFGGDDPIGRQVRLMEFMGLGRPIAIVGLVRDTRTLVLQDNRRPEIFLPLAQVRPENATLLVRTSDPATVQRAVGRLLREMDPALPPMTIGPLSDQLRRGLEDQRLYAVWATIFGGVALLLSAIGLYGALAFAVAQRTRDIGVRMALGAQRGDVMAMVMREGLTVVLAGAACGALGSLGAARLVGSQLYGVAPTDPVSFGVAAALLLGVAALAAWLPARRAMGVDPMAALRSE